LFVTFWNLFLKIHDLDRVAAMDELWNRALESLKERLGKQNFETWIKPASFVSLTRTELRLKVPNKFFRDWLTEHFLGQIEEAISSVAEQKISVIFDLNQQSSATKTPSEKRYFRRRRVTITFRLDIPSIISSLAQAISLLTPLALRLPTNPVFITTRCLFMAESAWGKLIWSMPSAIVQWTKLMV
jgi:chromosomal replication initiation ATPase DnaA